MRRIFNTTKQEQTETDREEKNKPREIMLLCFSYFEIKILFGL